MKTLKRKKMWTMLTMASFLPVAGASLAQETREIEEVLVTATKRVTSVETTPVAVSAFSQDSLDEQHVVSLNDLQGMVPSLHIAQNGTQNTPMVFMRGVGSTDQTENGDPAVAFHVDGIYSARSQGATMMMYDLESAEILRGPQGTLFGRNSTGGVVNLHTAKPKQEFDASVEYLVGSYDRNAARAMVNIPITDSWAIRFAGATDKADGDVDLLPGSTPGQKYDSTDLTSYRLSSLMNPTDSIEWFLSYEVFDDQGTGHAPTVEGGSDQSAFIQVTGMNDFHIRTLRTRLDYNFNNGMQLSYLGGDTSSTRESMWDRSWRTNFYEWGGCIECNHDATQHELQFKNGDDNRFKWMLGAFWFKEENLTHFDIAHPVADSGSASWQTFRQPNRGLESTSYFGQGTFDVTDTLRLTLGARHTNDERWDEGGRNIACPTNVNSLSAVAAATTNLGANRGLAAPGQCWITAFNDTNPEWSKNTGMGRIEWDTTDHIMTYLSYSTGFKSGTIQDGAAYTGTAPFNQAELDKIITKNNDDVNATAAYVAPEENTNIELGIKGKFLDNRLQIMTALFHTTYKNLQVTSIVFLPTGLDTLRKTNAGESTINGVETEFKWLIGDNGVLDGSFAYLDATYDSFLTTDASFGAAGIAFNPSAGVASQPTLLDFGGNTMIQAPQYSLTLNYQHEFHLAGGGLLKPRVRMSYSDEIWFDAANRGDRPDGFKTSATAAPLPYVADLDRQDAYTKWDASIAYEPGGENWSLEAFVDNLTDEAIKTDQGRWNSRPEANFMWAPGRTYGVRVKVGFN